MSIPFINLLPNFTHIAHNLQFSVVCYTIKAIGSRKFHKSIQYFFAFITRTNLKTLDYGKSNVTNVATSF